MRLSQLLIAGICMLGVTSANACDVTIGDWKLVRGDVSTVERLPVSLPQKSADDLKNMMPKGNWKSIPRDPRPEVSVILSAKARTRFADITRQYASNIGNNHPLPIMAGSIKEAPVLYEPILDGRFVLRAAKDRAEVDKLIKTLRNCI